LWLVNGWRAWRRTLPFGIGLAAAVVAVLATTALLHRVGILQGGGEHGAVGLLMRQFGAIALLDVERVLWALIPSGLYPAAVLLMWKSSDEPGRVLIAATGLLFAFFYPMGEISLHYFVPVMVLPVAAFWRRWAGPVRWRPAAWAACTGAAAVAIYLALPRGSAVYDGTRLVGERIDVSALGGYHTNDPAALRATEALSLLWPNDAHPDVPDRRYGDSPLAWNYYAQRRPTSAATSYVLLPAGAALPPGAASAGRHESAVVGVYDHPAWMQDRALVPRRSQAKPILTVPRHVLFFDPQASPRAGFLQPHTWPWLRRLAGKPEDH
jgi:hypothetical protein